MESHNLPLEGLARTLVAQEREEQLNATEPYPLSYRPQAVPQSNMNREILKVPPVISHAASVGQPFPRPE